MNVEENENVFLPRTNIACVCHFSDMIYVCRILRKITPFIHKRNIHTHAWPSKGDILGSMRPVLKLHSQIVSVLINQKNMQTILK